MFWRTDDKAVNFFEEYCLKREKKQVNSDGLSRAARDNKLFGPKTDRLCLSSRNVQVPETPGRTTAMGSDGRRSVQVAAMDAGGSCAPKPSIAVVITQNSAAAGDACVACKCAGAHNRLSRRSPNKSLQQTGRAPPAADGFDAASRASRLLSSGVRQRNRDALPTRIAL